MSAARPLSPLAINHYLAPPGYPLLRFLEEAKEAGAAGVGLTGARAVRDGTARA